MSTDKVKNPACAALTLTLFWSRNLIPQWIFHYCWSVAFLEFQSFTKRVIPYGSQIEQQSTPIQSLNLKKSSNRFSNQLSNRFSNRLSNRFSNYRPYQGQFTGYSRFQGRITPLKAVYSAAQVQRVFLVPSLHNGKTFYTLGNWSNRKFESRFLFWTILTTKKRIQNQLYKTMSSSLLSSQKKVPSTVKNSTSANLKAQFSIAPFSLPSDQIVSIPWLSTLTSCQTETSFITRWSILANPCDPDRGWKFGYTAYVSNKERA